MIKLFSVFMIAGFLYLVPTPSFGDDTPAPDKNVEIAKLQSEIGDAIDEIADIVNQPVTHITRLPSAKVTIFSPGWFHDATQKPDFNTVDVRKTQALPYAKFPYVTSNLNPDEMFLGSELEFNPMTKFFYTDRSVPKKKLTEAEMIEINRLYRIIGSDEKKIAAFAPTTVEKYSGFWKNLMRWGNH